MAYGGNGLIKNMSHPEAREKFLTLHKHKPSNFRVHVRIQAGTVIISPATTNYQDDTILTAISYERCQNLLPFFLRMVHIACYLSMLPRINYTQVLSSMSNMGRRHPAGWVS